jgi:hypothetical protein
MDQQSEVMDGTMFVCACACVSVCSMHCVFVCLFVGVWLCVMSLCVLFIYIMYGVFHV